METTTNKETRELVETYMAKHGRNVEGTLAEVLKSIAVEGDGDSLFFFHRQLVEAVKTVQEFAASRPVVAESDPKARMTIN